MGRPPRVKPLMRYDPWRFWFAMNLRAAYQTSSTSASVTIDYLIVADRADVMGGKLYLMGGGFDRIQPPEFPLSLMLGIAVGVRVPYQETEDPHEVRVTLERADGDKLVEIEAELQTGRPPGMRGKDLPVPMAFNVPITVSEPGDYVLTAHVDGRERRRHQITASKRGG